VNRNGNTGLAFEYEWVGWGCVCVCPTLSGYPATLYQKLHLLTGIYGRLLLQIRNAFLQGNAASAANSQPAILPQP